MLLQAGRALGNGFHYIEDSHASGGHMLRGEDGRIKKAFSFDEQSPALHKKNADDLPEGHPDRQAALEDTAEYVRLVEEHRGDPEALEAALREGIFATDIDESIPTPNQPRATAEEAIQKAKDYVIPEKEPDEH